MLNAKTGMLFVGFIVVLTINAPSRALSTHTYGNFQVFFYDTGNVLTDGSLSLTAARSFTVQELQAMSDCCSYIQSQILDTSTARTTNIHFIWASDMSEGTLGFSYSNFQVLNTSSYGNVALTDTQKLWAFDSYVSPGSTKDCIIAYNPTESWYSGTGTPTSGALDFRSVVTHELTHALGFLSSYDSDTSTFDIGGYRTVFDHFLVDADGNVPNDGGYGTPSVFDATDDPVYWSGEYATAVYRSMPGVAADALIPIYAPDPYEPGSSLAHIDERGWDGILGTADDLDVMMNYSIAPEEVKRTYSDVELAMLKDIGWDVDVVPEPATLTLLACGAFALIKRRKSRRG